MAGRGSWITSHMAQDDERELPASKAGRVVEAKVPAAPAKAPRGGRPRLEEEGNTTSAQKPWLALRMSERTWYRRQREERAKAKGETE